MVIYASVKEKTLEEVRKKTESQTSDFNQISYLENVVNQQQLTFDIKKWGYTQLSELYEKKRYYDKAARALLNRTTIEITYRERIATFLRAAELFVKGARMEDAIQTFMKAFAEGNSQEKMMIKQKMMDSIRACAEEAEKSGKRNAVIPYYQKLLELPIGEKERQQVKDKLASLYKSLGKFAEAKSLELGFRGQQAREREVKDTRTLDEKTRKTPDNDLGIEFY
jgi:tetratricopeptide (TPR) repeat protein